MADILPALTLALLAVVILFQFLQWKRRESPTGGLSDVAQIQSRLELLGQLIQQTDRGVRDEFSRLRLELAGQHEAFGTGTNQKLELLRTSLAESGSRLQEQVSRELETVRSGLTHTAKQSREETSAAIKSVSESVGKSVSDLTTTQKAQLDEIRATVEARLTQMSADNEKRLEQMRQTVDEKLQGTLEARLGESFKLVSDRLEQVHKGLGEMQTLASGVGDLKRVLTNVKTRGTWGEVQLGSLLEQMLTPDQYGKNIATTGTQEHVEFAIRLPGREPGDICWLPVDAKFPVETYNRLVDAAEQCDAEAVDQASRALEVTLKACARAISEKYLLPPATTDFGMLYLPTEGLYAEALRRPGLAETLQREYRVILTGPNTFAAILNSLQMGFRTLAIQQRSSEVWEILRGVQTQFGKYAGVLAEVKKKLQQATDTIEKAETRTRVLQKHLRGVEAAPGPAPHVPDVLPFDLESLGSVTGDPPVTLPSGG